MHRHHPSLFPAPPADATLLTSVERLIALTQAERRAVVQLETDLIERLSAEKTVALRALQAELAARQGPLSVHERRTLQVAFRRLAAESEAQVALLQDAREQLEVRLGVGQEPTTYDGRARVVRPRTSLPAPGI